MAAPGVTLYGLLGNSTILYRLDSGVILSGPTSPQGTLVLTSLPAFTTLEIGAGGILLPSINTATDTLLAAALGVSVALIDQIILPGRPWPSVAAAIQALTVAMQQAVMI